jgi:hypothetical protein
MKEHIEEFKELWSDKKKRAAILLILWMMFLLFVISLARTISANSATTTNTTEPIGYVEYDNYEFTITTADLTLTGAHYGNKSLFTSSDGNKYYIEDDKLYSVVGDNLTAITDISGHQIIKLQPKYLGDLINKSSYEYSVTGDDGVEKKSYSVSSTDYYKLYNQDAPQTEFIIPMYVYITNGYVSKIEFSNIVITYSNIGKVSDFTLTNN